MSCQTSDGRQLEMGLMRTASNSSLTQKYRDKTKHVSITVLIVLKLIGSPVLTQLRTGPKQCRFSIPIGKNRVPRGPPGPRGPTWVAWCLNTLLCVGSRCAGKLDLASELEIEGESGGAPVKKNKHLFKFNNSWTEELNVLSQSHVNNAHTFCKVLKSDFNIGHDGENAISQHIQRGCTKHTMLMYNVMYNVM